MFLFNLDLNKQDRRRTAIQYYTIGATICARSSRSRAGTSGRFTTWARSSTLRAATAAPRGSCAVSWLPAASGPATSTPRQWRFRNGITRSTALSRCLIRLIFPGTASSIVSSPRHSSPTCRRPRRALDGDALQSLDERGILVSRLMTHPSCRRLSCRRRASCSCPAAKAGPSTRSSTVQRSPAPTSYPGWPTR